MGKTAFAGPVYGAKAPLIAMSWAGGAISSNASTTVVPAAVFQVPTYEVWMVTEAFATVSTCSSNSAQFLIKYESPAFGGTLDGRALSSASGTLFTIASGTSTSIATISTCATTAGEYEGKVIPPNSTIRIVSSANSAMGVTHLNIIGYRRYVETANRTV